MTAEGVALVILAGRRLDPGERADAKGRARPVLSENGVSAEQPHVPDASPAAGPARAVLRQFQPVVKVGQYPE